MIVSIALCTRQRNPICMRSPAFHLLLLVARVKTDLEHAEALDSPEQEPGLAGILAGVSGRESLYQVFGEKLDVGVLLQRGRRSKSVWDVLEQCLFRGSLGIRRLCPISVSGRMAGDGHSESVQVQGDEDIDQALLFSSTRTSFSS